MKQRSFWRTWYRDWLPSAALVTGTIALIMSAGIASPAAAATKTFVCPTVATPVVSLDYGSRYKEGDASHSEIDDAADAAVDAALKPVDNFIASLVRISNAALFLDDGQRQARVDCVAKSLASWATAGALTGLNSQGANLSVGGRLAGLAFAVRQVDEVGPIDPALRKQIVDWLVGRAEALTAFFDENNQMMASRNNLRAWTGLGVGLVGLVAKRDDLVKWGQDSFRRVACDANADGSLPYEMRRASRALSYQLHAVGPLVLSAELFAGPGFDAFSECDGVLRRIVNFTVAAIRNPAIVETIAGKPQNFKTADLAENGFTLAWAEPYLTHVEDDDLDALVRPLRPLSNSKLGGNLTKLYGKTL